MQATSFDIVKPNVWSKLPLEAWETDKPYWLSSAIIMDMSIPKTHDGFSFDNMESYILLAWVNLLSPWQYHIDESCFVSILTISGVGRILVLTSCTVGLQLLYVVDS